MSEERLEDNHTYCYNCIALRFEWFDGYRYVMTCEDMPGVIIGERDEKTGLDREPVRCDRYR